MVGLIQYSLLKQCALYSVLIYQLVLPDSLDCKVLLLSILLKFGEIDASERTLTNNSSDVKVTKVNLIGLFSSVDKARCAMHICAECVYAPLLLFIWLTWSASGKLIIFFLWLATRDFFAGKPEICLRQQVLRSVSIRASKHAKLLQRHLVNLESSLWTYTRKVVSDCLLQL